MHNIIKHKILIAVFLIITFICGCTYGKVRVTKNTSKTETDTEIISVEIPEIRGMNEDFCSSINQEIMQSIEEKKQSFSDTLQSTKDERDEKAKLDISCEVEFNKNNLLSILGECYEYTSGLTGASSRKTVNIDCAAEKIIYLADLFNDTEYVNFLNSKLEKMSEAEEYSDIWEKPQIGEAQNEYFYLNDEGLVIFYPPYELSYYARGFVEFCIPYSELYGYLKPEYASLY